MQAVFFKTSLNTGWDCPRAEVMMSFRRAVDATLIAQLVGRMVRSPLARRIIGSDLLNRVTLYLPHYSKQGVEHVVKQLTGDAGTMSPTELEDARELATLTADSEFDPLFPRVNQLPSYTIPRRQSVHEAHRIMCLARVMEDADISENARDLLRQKLIAVLLDELHRREKVPEFQQSLSEGGTISVRVLTYAAEKAAENTISIAASDENVRHQIDAIGRRLREGLHLAYIKVRTESDGVDARRARLELAALYRDNVAHDALMLRARQLTADCFAELAPTFSVLPPVIQARLNEIRASSASPEIQPILMPSASISVTIDSATKELGLRHHLHKDIDGHYPGKLNSWELAVVREEMKRPDFVAWLRNLPRKPWALTILYESSVNEIAPLFPDLLFFRRVGDGLVVDLLDPHLTAFDDAAPKAWA